MNDEKAFELINVLKDIKAQLKRIAELSKVKLWYIMEDDKTTTRQKQILTEMLKKL